MSLPGALGLGAAGGGLRFAQTRGRIGNGMNQGVNYPSPFFDIAHTYLPITVKSMFRWCRYYFLTNPTINATVFKLSEYPITDIIIDHPVPSVAKKWKEYFEDHLNFRSFQVECGLDYHVYGNCLAGMSFPFKKHLSCMQCGFQAEARRIRPHWVFTNYEYRLSCPKCGHLGTASARDLYYRNENAVRTMRWSPEDVEISYSDMTGEYTHFYNIPPAVRNDIVIGKKDAVEQVPEVFIQALRQQKGVVYSKDMFFHMRRPTLADQDRGWGIPLLLPCLKDTFYLQIMKKAQESILLDHIIPLRILFPQAGSGSADPYVSTSLVDWRDHVATEIARWRMDPSYIPILPLPVGNQTIGGDGRALLLNQEMQMLTEQLINGMQVPLEFIKGGLSWSGSNVSMRMLENQFIVYLSRHARMARWVMRQVADYLKWPMANIRFKPFKMADDIQRKAYRLQLSQAGKISDTTLLADDDLDQSQENQIIERETADRVRAMEKQQMATAELQGKQQILLMKMQAKAQQELQAATAAPTAPGEPGAPDGPMAAMQSPVNASQDMAAGGQAGGSNIVAMASTIAMQLSQQDPAQQHLALKRLREQSPELATLVEQFLQSVSTGAQVPGASDQPGVANSAPPGINMQPLPEQRPPRRSASPV